jgi:hypothetical protein
MHLSANQKHYLALAAFLLVVSLLALGIMYDANHPVRRGPPMTKDERDRFCQAVPDECTTEP